jgi:hypothetical protein
MDIDVLHRVDDAIADFVAATDGLRRAPSQDTAEDACMTCRDAVQLFFFVRDEYKRERPKEVRDLLDALDDAESALKELTDLPGRSSHVAQYLESVQLRKELVDAVIRNSSSKIKHVLQEGWEAAEMPSS